MTCTDTSCPTRCAAAAAASHAAFTAATSPAVLVNLLGAEGYSGPAVYEGMEKALSVEGAAVHIYGKEETKPFRKMGHVTLTGSDVDSLLQKAQTIKKQFRVIA